MTGERAEWLIEFVGYCLIGFVVAHWIGWWIVPLGAGVGLVRGSRA